MGDGGLQEASDRLVEKENAPECDCGHDEDAVLNRPLIHPGPQESCS